MNKLKTIRIEQIKGISKRMIEHLHNQGIDSVYDLLYYFPYRYENYEVINLHQAEDNEKVTVVGQVVTEPVFYTYKRNHSRLTFCILVNDLVIKIVAFNRDFLRNKISKSMFVTVTGKYEQKKAQIIAQKLSLKSLDSDRIEPVYSLKNLHKTYFLNIMKKALQQYHHLIDEDLPLSLMDKYRLIGNQDMISFVHFPINHEQIRQVYRRVKYEELLKFQLKILYLKNREHKNQQKKPKSFKEELIKQFISLLPFDLTNDQHNVTKEILNDMKETYQMNRLIQGDVGSGKTVVAVISLYANYLSGYQGCLMAPTEILAEQHYHYLNETFKDYSLKIELLTSSITGKNRKQLLNALAMGSIDILVGTHALISEGVNFNHLGLIIIDEQHRFGVNQRKILREKGQTLDALFLSATPIPRTLALTAFGDMEVSSIKEMPKGRKQIKTYLIKSQLEERLVQFIDKIIQENQQVYIITPLIEESEKIDLENAIDIYEKYKTYFKDKYKVGLLHGKMISSDKEQVMNDFMENKTQILVSTTVVEVGVNVLNATLMIIVDAHRFGLAQLHQLRGRVGRSDKQSYCILVSDYENDKTKERLDILTKTNNGFEIADEDLRLRGPGDFFGSRQSGLPEFKMADLVNDYHILDVAREDAKMIIETNELFTNPEYFALKYYIENELIDNNELFD
ncbi:ATP-dependent DNA helicase RecG [Mycoplasmatota bacterium]|nr:ATP-dependent DNA helicase RecG [Mycoplasmatota bacterium]